MTAPNKKSNALDAGDLVLCAGTVAGASFTQLVAAARAGGFNAISLFPPLYRQARSVDKLSDSDLRQLLADNGLCIAELDCLLNWIPGHPFPGSDDNALAGDEDEFYRIAQAVGGRSLNVVMALPERLPMAQIVDAFAAVCERAAAHDLLVQIEFVPWAQIDNVNTALDLVQQSGQRNAGIMFDSWHHFRSGIGDAALAQIPGDKFFGIQLNDAPAQAEADIIAETMQRRLLPGAGAIDLEGIIRQLDRNGSRAPLGVEVFSSALAQLPAEEIGRRAGTSLRSVLTRARAADSDDGRGQ